MGGPYAAMLLPFRLFFGKKVHQWKTHSYISLLMKFQARFCLDNIFTATPSSFAMNLDKVRVIGHGIDTDLFRIISAEKLSTSIPLTSPSRKLLTASPSPITLIACTLYV